MNSSHKRIPRLRIPSEPVEHFQTVVDGVSQMAHLPFADLQLILCSTQGARSSLVGRVKVLCLATSAVLPRQAASPQGSALHFSSAVLVVELLLLDQQGANLSLTAWTNLFLRQSSIPSPLLFLQQLRRRDLRLLAPALVCLLVLSARRALCLSDYLHESPSCVTGSSLNGLCHCWAAQESVPIEVVDELSSCSGPPSSSSVRLSFSGRGLAAVGSLESLDQHFRVCEEGSVLNCSLSCLVHGSIRSCNFSPNFLHLSLHDLHVDLKFVES